MTKYEKVLALTRPDPITFTANTVEIASDVMEKQLVDDDNNVIANFQYTLTSYTKDEYLATAFNRITELEEELAATKIILGVE